MIGWGGRACKGWEQCRDESVAGSRQLWWLINPRRARMVATDSPSQPVIPHPINGSKKATGAWPNGLSFTIKLAGGERGSRVGLVASLFLVFLTNNLVISSMQKSREDQK